MVKNDEKLDEKGKNVVMGGWGGGGGGVGSCPMFGRMLAWQWRVVSVMLHLLHAIFLQHSRKFADCVSVLQ